MISASTNSAHLLNGILCPPADPHEWTDDGATWIEHRLGWRARKEEYFAGPILAHLFNPMRARILALHLDEDRRSRLFLGCHSNGAAIACRASRLENWPPVHRLTLIAGAVSCDFDRNGLNEALRLNRVGKIVVTVSEKDEALHIAHHTGWCHEPLGLFGPKNANYWIGRGRVVIVRQHIGHSAWFSRPLFDSTLEMICGVKEHYDAA